MIVQCVDQVNHNVYELKTNADDFDIVDGCLELIKEGDTIHILNKNVWVSVKDETKEV